MAAGFSGLFQTPIAATFFAIEILMVGKIEYIALFPALVASYVASFTSHYLGLEKFSYSINTNIHLDIFYNL
jgi:Chloride channel protein EriC